jgi:Domain of unknown function (DUF4383)
MLKVIAIIFGIIMIIAGILGFIPQTSPNGLLLGLFHVNLLHNWIHIITGIVSLLCGLNSEEASRTFFQVFGILYGIVAILGYFYGDYPIFGWIANNLADAILHTVIAVIALYLGFGYYPTERREDIRQ